MSPAPSNSTRASDMFSSQYEMSDQYELLPLWGAAVHTTTPGHTFPPTHVPPHAGFHPNQGILQSSFPAATAGQLEALEYKLDMLNQKLNEILSKIRSHTGEIEHFKKTYQELVQQQTRKFMGCLSQMKRMILDAMVPGDAHDFVGGV
ncbi:uncharacterized protein PG986_014376 [Apiospora aurea]|uniref:Uncharacterized protein n=1 Tax=Apiospora aurea TaxID=335848 RepID=A0ABR1PT46_9PEZI